MFTQADASFFKEASFELRRAEHQKSTSFSAQIRINFI